MIQILKNKTTLFLATLLLWCNASFADPGFPIENDPGDPAVAPIDDWIPLLFVIGVAIVFYAARKRIKAKQQVLVK